MGKENEDKADMLLTISGTPQGVVHQLYHFWKI